MPANSEALDQFTELVSQLRPQLFRYCARMTGSVFDGEDIVQETLARAYAALTRMNEPPALKAWIFRIAHNTAMDFLKSYAHKHVEVVSEVPELVDADETGVDDALVEAALTVFVALPPAQRSALALKDVLGFSLVETANMMGSTVPAVKSALARARANVGVPRAEPLPTISAEERDNLQRYAELFNARNWDGLRALLGEEARLDLVSRNARGPEPVGSYYTQYMSRADGEDLRAVPGVVDGIAALAMFRPSSSPMPAYFILLEWKGQRVDFIRDFRYVPYIADGARFRKLSMLPRQGTNS